jgi:hypothetical protein
MVIAKTQKQERRAANVIAMAVDAGVIKVKAHKNKIHRNPNPKTSRKAKPYDPRR